VIQIKKKLGRATEIGIVTTSNNKEVVEKSDIIFLCVKPNNIKEILEEIKNSIQDQIIISIAAGIRIKQIEKVIGDKKIVRVMPNLNCVVKEMAAAFCCNKQITSQDKEKVKKILNFAGLAIEVQEDQMDVVTALSGSGPAFITYILNVISKSAEIQGLSKQVSYQLALQTFLGTAKLLKQTKEDPNNLIKRVASPGDYLIVIVARDENILRFKGKKSKNNETYRLNKIKDIDFVDEAILGHKEDILEVLNEFKPDIICLGYDQRTIDELNLKIELNKRNLKAEIIRTKPYQEDVYKSSKFK